ncbi:MAG: site-specific DNA-methyltransferase [Phycisphaerales bacterium]|jgi:site-specific DNA-methyltransferase (adenine-specific)|nr:site-specific DNA-methyltransferase [Phycisphaerales bacterium]
MASRKKSVARVGDMLEREHPDTGVRARVRIGDCRTELEKFDEAREGSVDLVFADPPFNWARAYDRWDDKMPEDEYLTFTYDWLDLCVRALRPGGALWVNIPDDWAAEITAYLKGRLFVGGAGRRPPAEMEMENWCVWHYRFGQNVTERFINSKVHALYFVKAGGERTWNPTEVLEVSDRRAIYGDPRTESKRDGMPAGLRVPMDVWYGKFWGRIQGNNKERRAQHDNQLPEVYLERVVRACSNPGDLVLDPFTGSGTTGVVAHALGRNFIGTEFSPENAARAFERIGLGPVRELGQGPQSTAIFENRRTTRATTKGEPEAKPARRRSGASASV